MSGQSTAILRPLVGYSFLFVLGYIKGGLMVGVACSMSFVAAHLNEFYLLRAILKLVKGATPLPLESVPGACGVVMGIALIAWGFGAVFAVATATLLLLDALLVRFR